MKKNLLAIILLFSLQVCCAENKNIKKTKANRTKVTEAEMAKGQMSCPDAIWQSEELCKADSERQIALNDDPCLEQQKLGYLGPKQKGQVCCVGCNIGGAEDDA